MLPNFLLIGAMKAGTTSLWQYLRAHPEVFMPAPKELYFFNRSVNFDRGLDWYESRFADGSNAVAVGEASTSYTKFPHNPDSAPLIHEYLPDVRLVYSIRHPLRRIVSHYLHSVAVGQESATFEKAVTSPGNIYVGTSSYALQIERYLEFFPRDQLLIMTAEELKRDRATTMRSVFSFLGVRDDPTIDLDREHYLTESRRGFRPLAASILSVPGVRAATKVLPRRARAAGRRLVTAPIEPSTAEIDDELSAKLLDMLRDDLIRLRTIVGDDFDAWGLV